MPKTSETQFSLEFIQLASTPYEEECAQVGTDDYPERSRLECRVFIQERVYPIPEPLAEHCYYSVKSFSHDHGRYREVVIHYNTANAAAITFAFALESKLPSRWDEEARLALGLEANDE